MHQSFSLVQDTNLKRNNSMLSFITMHISCQVLFHTEIEFRFGDVILQYIFVEGLYKRGFVIA